MFKIDMESILKSGNGELLIANVANAANFANSPAVLPISSPLPVEKLARLAISNGKMLKEITFSNLG